MLGSSFGRSFYQEQQASIPNDFIYDQVYKNASFKNKYSRNPKYIYYNALLSMKQKLSEQQSPVLNSLFANPPKKEKSATLFQQGPNPRKTLTPIYHVQKINKMKFKLYKQATAQFVEKLPVTDLSFQIRIKGDQNGQMQSQNKPRLEQILHQYRKMNVNRRSFNIKAGGLRRSSFSHAANSNVKWMRNTMSKIGRSATTQRK